MTPPVGGVDPRQDTFTLGIVDANGVELTHETYDNTAVGYGAAIDLLDAHGVCQVGVEGSAKWGAHVGIALAAAGFDAREVPVSRSAAQCRSRRLDKTDAVDAVASARALLAEPALGPVQALEVYDPLVAEIEAVLEHRRALAAAHTLGLHHAADQISKPPAEIRDQLASVGKIEARLRRLEHIDPASATTPAGRYRLAQLQTFIDQDRQARHEIRRLERLINELLDQHGTTLRDEPGIGPISAASSKPLMHTGAGFALNFAAAVPPRAPLAQVTVTVVAAPTNNDTAALIFATNRSRAGHLSQPDTSEEFPTASCHGSSG